MDLIRTSTERALEKSQEIEKLLQKMLRITQNRTPFQLKHFVVGSHDKPGRQYWQVMMELQSLMMALGDMADDMEMAHIELQETIIELENESDKWKKEKHQVNIRRMKRKYLSQKFSITARIREADYLLELLNTMPEYTLDEIIAEEPEYWRVRLRRQAYLGMRGAATGMGFGNLDAILQMATEPGEDKPNLTKEIDTEQLLAAAGMQALLSDDGKENDDV